MWASCQIRVVCCYFGIKTASVLMQSADQIEDSCAGAVTEAITLRKRYVVFILIYFYILILDFISDFDFD